SVTATGTQIDGSDAFKFSVVTGGAWQAFLSDAATSVVGDTISLTLSVMGVGSVTSAMFGIYGDTSGWSGALTPTTGAIASAPGALTQPSTGYYSLWAITGLSTTQATRLTITRRTATSAP